MQRCTLYTDLPTFDGPSHGPNLGKALTSKKPHPPTSGCWMLVMWANVVDIWICE